MVLVDTSVWIVHFKVGRPELVSLLESASVLMHPLVIGELACGTFQNRTEIFKYFSAMPMATAATHDEVMKLVESRQLMGRGVGWIDLHLLASALLTHCFFWTLDKRLAALAESVGVQGLGISLE